MRNTFLLICGLIILCAFVNESDAQYRRRRGRVKVTPVKIRRENPDGPIGKLSLDLGLSFGFGGASYGYTSKTSNTTVEEKVPGSTGEFRIGALAKFPISPMLTLNGGIELLAPGTKYTEKEGEQEVTLSFSRKCFLLHLGVRIHLP